MTSRPQTPARQRRVAANGLDLAVTEYPGADPKRGRPLVLLHGIGSRAVSWWPVVDALAARFHLYALDLRGHGASAKPVSGYLLPDYAADLAGVLDVLNLDRPLLLGHSLGGLVVLMWAADNPERAAGIVVEDVALRATPQILSAFDGWLALATMPLERAAAYYRSQHPEWSDEDCRRRAESITLTAPAVFAELRTDSEANLESGSDRLSLFDTIRSATLLVHGNPARGSAVVPEDAVRFAATLPNARLARVPGAGHSIHRDHPEAFLERVIPFLEGVE